MSGTDGPLMEGELDRVRLWGEAVASEWVGLPLGQAVGTVFDSVEGEPFPVS